VRVSGTEIYVKKWAAYSADWYNTVGEGYCLSVFCVNFLQLELFDCKYSEDGSSDLQRNLTIIWLSAWSDI